jgi:tetratricopeptide (TPR) repeat protein
MSRKHRKHSTNITPQDTTKASVAPLSRSKRRLFTLLLVLIPFLLLSLLEAGLRIFHYGQDLRLFVSAPEEFSKDYYYINRTVARRFFYMQSVLPAPPKDFFLKRKPQNGFRVFVLGESTAAGFPYGNNVTFPRILQYRLSDAFPGRQVEVVNTGMSAVSSYAMLDFMDEILEQKPDAILVYAGHNEFYGAMAVASMESLGKNRAVVLAYLRLERLKLFMLLRDWIGKVRVWVIRNRPGGVKEDSNVTLMERIAANENIPLHGEVYEKGRRQFEANLRAIVNKAKKAGVSVLLSELVSNVRDQKPFGSNDLDSTLSAAKTFALARRLENQRQFGEAGSAYDRAKDLDPVRFRAAEEFNDVISRIAVESGVPVVPMKRIFERASKNELVGDGLMADHLHPDVDGYFLMADAFFDGMRRNRLAPEAWDSTRIRQSSFYRSNWGYTEFDSVYAALGIRYLKSGWPFQPKTAVNPGLSGYRPVTKAESLAVRIVGAKKSNENTETCHYTLARSYMKNGEWEKAFGEFRALYTSISFENLFYEGAVSALLNLNRPDRALEVLDRSLKTRETFFADKWTGLILVRAKKDSLGIPYLEKARASSPSDVQVLRALYQAYRATNASAKAEALAYSARNLIPPERGVAVKPGTGPGERPADAERLLEEAARCASKNDLDRALGLLTQSLSIRETFEAHNRIGQIYLKTKRFREAVPHLESAVRIRPDDPGCLYNLSSAYLFAGRLDKASAAAGELERIDPVFKGLDRLKGRIQQELDDSRK